MKHPLFHPAREHRLERERREPPPVYEVLTTEGVLLVTSCAAWLDYLIRAGRVAWSRVEFDG